jgi:hypothetical protein
MAGESHEEISYNPLGKRMEDARRKSIAADLQKASLPLQAR